MFIRKICLKVLCHRVVVSYSVQAAGYLQLVAGRLRLSGGGLGSIGFDSVAQALAALNHGCAIPFEQLKQMLYASN